MDSMTHLATTNAYIHQPIYYVSIQPSINQPMHPLIYLSIHPSTYSFIYSYPFLNQPIHPSTYLSFYRSEQYQRIRWMMIGEKEYRRLAAEALEVATTRTGITHSLD
jgi:hypothetical protein